ncbi:MAG: protein kinase [Candidatus Omnitrophota bacterium]
MFKKYLSLILILILIWGQAACAPVTYGSALRPLSMDETIRRLCWDLSLGEDEYEQLRELGFTVTDKLGEGSFFIAYLARNDAQKTGIEDQFVVIKLAVSDLLKGDPVNPQDIMADYERLGRHENVIHIHRAAMLDEDTMYMVEEYYNGTKLKDELEGRGLLSGNTADILLRKIKIAGQVWRALHYMHGKGVYHGDLSVSRGNIMIDEDLNVKLLDRIYVHPPGQVSSELDRRHIYYKTLSDEQKRLLDITLFSLVLTEMFAGGLRYHGDGVDFSEMKERITKKNPVLSDAEAELLAGLIVGLRYGPEKVSEQNAADVFTALSAKHGGSGNFRRRQSAI